MLKEKEERIEYKSVNQCFQVLNSNPNIISSTIFFFNPVPQNLEIFIV